MKNQQQNQNRPLLIIGVLVAAALLSALVERSRSSLVSKNVPPPTATSLRERNDASRALSVSQFSDPKSVSRRSPGPGEPAVATIYLVQTDVEAISLFHTDVLTRYGTGRLQYNVVDAEDTCNPTCKLVDVIAPPPELGPGPCLAVSRYFKGFSCDIDSLKCNYPLCKTMVTNDEYCQIGDSRFDFRQYHSASIDSTSFPLGPRLDTWKSFQALWAQHPASPVLPSSRRKYAFNAIFSQGTHRTRRDLAKLIKSRGEQSSLNVYAEMAKKWAASANDPRTKQVNTDTVVRVMSDSVFTLAPRGHHPECFRLFEAAEAGSIPVLTTGDFAEGTGTRCQDPLGQWRDAPWVVLDSWEDLYPTVEGLMQDPNRLDQMQQKFAAWYEGYMRGAVVNFEDALLASAPSAVPGEGSALSSEAMVLETPLVPVG